MTDEREDLIERLATAYESTGDPLYYAEAADALERLERERDEARADAKLQAQQVIERFQAGKVDRDEIARLTRERDEARRDKEHALARESRAVRDLENVLESNTALRAEVERLPERIVAATDREIRRADAAEAEVERLRGLLRRWTGSDGAALNYKALVRETRAALAEAPGDEGGDDDQ